MTNKLFNVSVITPDTTVYEGKIVSLIVPTELGYLGVLGHHAPLVANIASGKISLKKDSAIEPTILNYEGTGIMEVRDNEVTIFLDNFKS